MVVARVVKVADFNPSVLRDIIGLALLRSFIRVLRADGVDVILRLVVELPVEMC
jgi:hypothetical protein